MANNLVGGYKKAYRVILIGLLLICGSVLAYRYYFYSQEIKRQEAFLEQRKAAWQVLKQEVADEIRRFKGRAGVVIKDLKLDWEISYNRDGLFPSASLAKVPIMAACFLASEEGRLNLDQQIVLKNSDKFGGSGILKNVQAGATFTVEELIGLMIYESDNTATNILTSLLGIDYLNDAFNRLGLKNTNLSRRIADFGSRNRGIENYTNAEDISLILERIYRGKLIKANISKKCLGILKLQRINDRIPKYLPVDIMVAHKTGLERNVCHDAGIIFSCKGDFLICVLTRHTNPNAVASKNFIARVALRTYVYSEKLP
jgi:beta-lactamase class A